MVLFCPFINFTLGHVNATTNNYILGNLGTPLALLMRIRMQ